MILRYIYHSGLAQASYLLGCPLTREALVIDPNRDLDQYLTLAANEGLQIRAVVETHIHADFASGARELAQRTGATLYLSAEGGDQWQYRFPHTALRDGDRFTMGQLQLEALHTPGHTPEHLCYSVTDSAAADQPMGLFTGDFLFVGDIGRPDLLEEAAHVAGSKEPAARALFAAVQRFKGLEDYLQIWPGHGAGSACGRALGAVPSSTVGYERRFNWAFQIEEEAAFVEEVLTGQPEPPRYFAVMKRINRDGPPLLSEREAPQRLAAEQLRDLLAQGATVVDSRASNAFVAAHIPGTLSIPLDSGFTGWAGTLLPYDQPFYLIVDDGERDRARQELSLVGLDNLRGTWPLSVLETWQERMGPLPQVEVQALWEAMQEGAITVLDVRRAGEHEAGAIPGARNLPLQQLVDRLGEIDPDRPLYVHCQSGLRSALATAYLRSKGFHRAASVTNGLNAWQAHGYETDTAGQPDGKRPAAGNH